MLLAFIMNIVVESVELNIEECQLCCIEYFEQVQQIENEKEKIEIVNICQTDGCNKRGCRNVTEAQFSSCKIGESFVLDGLYISETDETHICDELTKLEEEEKSSIFPDYYDDAESAQTQAIFVGIVMCFVIFTPLFCYFCN